jgi:hypothetical protein
LSGAQPQLSELERKNEELEEYLNLSVGELNAEIRQKAALAELQDLLAKGLPSKPSEPSSIVRPCFAALSACR